MADIQSQGIENGLKINSPHTKRPYNYESFKHLQTAQEEFGHFWELKKPTFLLFIYHWDTAGYYRYREDTSGHVLYSSHYTMEAGIDSLVDSVSFVYQTNSHGELISWRRVMLSDSAEFISTHAHIERDSLQNIELVSLIDSNNSSGVRRFKKEEYHYDSLGRALEIIHTESEWGDTTLMNILREVFSYDSTGLNTHAFEPWDEAQSIFVDSMAIRVFGSKSEGWDSLAILRLDRNSWKLYDALVHRYDSLKRTTYVKTLWVEEHEWNIQNEIRTQLFFYEGNRLDSISNLQGTRFLGSTHFTHDSQSQLLQIELLMKEFVLFSSTDHIWYPSNYIISKPNAPRRARITQIGTYHLRFSWLDTSSDELGFYAVRRRGNSFVKDWKLPPQTTSLIDTLPFDVFIYTNLDYYVLSYNKYCYSDYSNTARWNGTSDPPYYSIGEQDENSTIKCYPNPAKNLISVEYEGAIPLTSLEVVALNGASLIYRELKSGSSMSIDIHSLSTGKYFVIARKKGGSFSILPFIKN